MLYNHHVHSTGHLRNHEHSTSEQDHSGPNIIHREPIFVAYFSHSGPNYNALRLVEFGDGGIRELQVLLDKCRRRKSQPLRERHILELVRVEDLEEAESGVSDILNIMTIRSRYKADISGLLPTISTIFTRGG